MDHKKVVYAIEAQRCKELFQQFDGKIDQLPLQCQAMMVSKNFVYHQNSRVVLHRTHYNIYTGH
jgi:hypothetical protein